MKLSAAVFFDSERSLFMGNEKKKKEVVLNEKGLNSNAIGGASSIIIAVASTGPALVIAVLVGTVVMYVGPHAPGMFIFSAIPVFLVMLCFRELFMASPDCGTAFTWVAKSIGPKSGFMAGWCLLCCSMVIMPSSAYVIAQNGFALFGAEELAGNKLATVLLSVGFIALVTVICYLGAEVVAWVQKLLVFIELGTVIWMLIACVVTMAKGEALPSAEALGGHMFLPMGDGVTITSFAGGFLICVFAYWGWDLTFTLGEETAGDLDQPFKSSWKALVTCVVVYASASFIILGTVGPDFMIDNMDILLDKVGGLVMGTFGGKLLICCTFTSILAATQATILPATRQIFAMACHGAFPKIYTKTNKFHAPGTATILVGVVSGGLMIVLAIISENIMFDCQSATSMMVAFYYGLTCFACFWKFRGTLKDSARNLILRGIVPWISVIVMIVAFILSAVSAFPAENSETTMFGVGAIFVLSVGVILLGVVFMLIAMVVNKRFFTGETLNLTEEELLEKR